MSPPVMSPPGACWAQVLQACLAGRQQPMRLMQAGMAFAVWTFQHASAEAIQPHAPAMLAKLLGLLDRMPPPLQECQEWDTIHSAENM